MKNLALLFSLFIALIFTTSCSEDDDPEVIDSSMPSGTFTASASGSFVAQSDTGSKGMASLGSDSDGTNFLKFDSDFETVLATGTVTVFLSTTNEDLSDVFDPGTGNQEVKLVGFVNANGEQYFKIDGTVDSKYTYVVLWCASAGVPFGYAELN